jgi:hypothetical protein
MQYRDMFAVCVVGLITAGCGDASGDAEGATSATTSSTTSSSSVASGGGTPPAGGATATSGASGGASASGSVTTPVTTSASLSISGAPAATSTVGVPYSFQPAVAPAGTTFFTIANKPAWLLFNGSTGRLEGTPTNADVGTYSGIRIQATQAGVTATLPEFSIEVSVVATSPSGSAVAGGLFSRRHGWNTDVSALSPSGRSDAIINTLVSLGGWGNGNVFQIDFSIPLFFADSSTPRIRIVGAPGGYCYGGPDCDPVPLQMPVPPDSNFEGSSNLSCDVANSDCHLLVVDRAQGRLYELYSATSTGADIAALGAFTWDLGKQYPPTLRGDQCTSADAAGLPIAALLPTADEVASGTVAHALRFILPNARMKRRVFVRPATHAGAPSSTNPDAPPYGVRFRLKASFDEAPYTANQRVILQALKKYGMILSDGGNIALTFADDRTSTAKWATLGITPQTYRSITPENFEVVDLGDEIPLTFDCVRTP